MRKPSIHFRSRGGATQGWGNIFRLATFARYCMEQGHGEICFFVEGPREVRTYLEEQDFKVVSLPEKLSLSEEAKIMSEYSNSDVLIMEMLECSYERQRMLRRHTGKLVVFDDLLDHYYCADIVVCGQVLPGYGNCSISEKRTRFFTGYDYFMCRPEFMDYREREKEYGDSIRNMVVLLGGGHYEIGFLKVAHALSALSQRIDPVFVLGYGDHGRLKEKLQLIVPGAEICGGVDNIEDMLWRADAAIVSGGYCKLEAAIIGTPSIMIATQWHQIPLAEEFHRHTGMPYAGYMSFFAVDELRTHIEALESRDKRMEMAYNGKAVVDGKGIERVYSNVFGNDDEI